MENDKLIQDIQNRKTRSSDKHWIHKTCNLRFAQSPCFFHHFGQVDDTCRIPTFLSFLRLEKQVEAIIFHFFVNQFLQLLFQLLFVFSTSHAWMSKCCEKYFWGEQLCWCQSDEQKHTLCPSFWHVCKSYMNCETLECRIFLASKSMATSSHLFNFSMWTSSRCFSQSLFLFINSSWHFCLPPDKKPGCWTLSKGESYDKWHTTLILNPGEPGLHSSTKHLLSIQQVRY